MCGFVFNHPHSSWVPAGASLNWWAYSHVQVPRPAFGILTMAEIFQYVPTYLLPPFTINQIKLMGMRERE